MNKKESPGKIEDCIDNDRDLFNEYFVTSIVDFVKILREKYDKLKIEVKHSMKKIIKKSFLLYK